MCIRLGSKLKKKSILNYLPASSALSLHEAYVTKATGCNTKSKCQTLHVWLRRQKRRAREQKAPQKHFARTRSLALMTWWLT